MVDERNAIDGEFVSPDYSPIHSVAPRSKASVRYRTQSWRFGKETFSYHFSWFSLTWPAQGVHLVRCRTV